MLNDKKQRGIVFRRKVFLVIIGSFLSLLILEAGMRAGAQAMLWAQELRNISAAKKRGARLILCLGESTTALGGADAYPAQLERILNSRGGGKKFVVLNAGIVAAKTDAIISRLKTDIDKYRPDMVVAMMGINDGYDHNLPYMNDRGLARKTADFISSLRVVKLARLIGLNIRRRGGKANAGVKPVSADKAYLEQALLFRHQGKFSEAVALLRKAWELNPRDDMICLELGCTYLFQGDYPASRDMFKKGMELCPGNDSVYYWSGVLAMEQGDTLAAKEFFSRSARINPLNDRAYGGLGTLYSGLSEKDTSQRGYTLADRVRADYYNPLTRKNFLSLKEITRGKGVKLVCAQYPMRGVGSLKRIFSGDSGAILFVDNERVFKDAVAAHGYQAYFTDMFGGDFGHCTARGNRLLAENIAGLILAEK